MRKKGVFKERKMLKENVVTHFEQISPPSKINIRMKTEGEPFFLKTV